MINKLPLVSIVIPIYNQNEQFLREAIESAINQTYLNIEILISDNHCTNGSSEIMAEYAQKNSKIKIIIPPVFLSMNENFRFSYSMASGEYICPLSSDDILYPDMVSELIKPYLEYPNLAFAFSIPDMFSKVIGDKKWLPGKFTNGFYSAKSFLNLYIRPHNCLIWGGLLLKTSSFNKIGGFSKECFFLADNDAIVKLILLKEKIYCVKKPLSAIRRWEREEQSNRSPYGLRDIATTSKYLETEINQKRFDFDPKIVQKIRKNLFLHELFPIPYFIQLNKMPIERIEKTVIVINENYPNGIFNFVLKNRNNKIGLAFSIIYLSIMKVKSWISI